MNLRRRFEKIRTILLLALNAGIISGTCVSQPLGGLADQLRQNTVRIQGRDNGFGFIVGEQDGYLYIVTARHILLNGEQPDAPVPTSAHVTFYSDQGSAYNADILGTHEGDIAVLRARTPKGFRWVKECLAGSDAVKRGSQVWFVGKRNEWYVPAQPGSIASDQPSARSEIEVDGLAITHGTSGAPLIASSGIVAMIQTDSAYDTRALTIEFIERAFHQWNYPWDLSETSQAKGASDLELINTPLELTASQDFTKFDYGFSLIGHDAEVRGSRLKIARVAVDVSLRSYSQIVCCDVWVLLASSPEMLSSAGQVTAGQNPVLIEPHAPVQIQFVLGTGGAPVSPGVHTLHGSYDLDTNLPSGQIDRMKSIIGRYVDLPNGLYAQVFFWNGNPNVNVEVRSAHLHVDFEHENEVSFIATSQ